MSTLAVPEPLFTVHLQAAQLAWECVPSGADIAVLEGTVRLHRLTYQAGMWLELPLLLQEGEQHRVEVAGWIKIEAVGAAKVCGVERPGWGIASWLYSCFDSTLCRGYIRWRHFFLKNS